MSCAGAEALLLAAGFERVAEQLEVPGSRTAAEVATLAQAALDALKAMTAGYELSAQLRAEGDVRCVAALPSGGVAFGAMDNVVRVFATGVWSESPQLLFG